MLVGLYAVFDIASGVYDGPIPMQTDEVAKRNFYHAVINADSPISKNPEHFSLHRVGEWNDATGVPSPENKVCIMTGLEAVAQSKNIVPINDQVDIEEAIENA